MTSGLKQWLVRSLKDFVYNMGVLVMKEFVINTDTNQRSRF